MPPAQADVHKAQALVADLEPQLQGHLFLGGAKPSQKDVEKFNEIMGENNIAFQRWARHMASFTEAERASWGKPESQ